MEPWFIEARDPAGVLLGAIAGEIDSANDELRLELVVVDEAYRNCGVGDRLLAEAQLFALARSLPVASVVVPGQGWVAKWYARRGYWPDLALPRWREGRDYVRLVRDL